MVLTGDSNHLLRVRGNAIATSAMQLLEKGDGDADVGVQQKTRNRDDSEGKNRSRLYCATCDHPITSIEQRIEVNGVHEHTFANPGGHVFNIGCFRGAPGTISMPGDSSSFTWFAGYAWAASGCSLCGVHLGWRFRSTDDVFFGLILASLVEKDGPET